MGPFISGLLGIGTGIVSGALTEPTSGLGYARVPVSFSTVHNGITLNTLNATFGPVSGNWGTLTAFQVYDSFGNPAWTGTLTQPVTPRSGGYVYIPAGRITVEVDQTLAISTATSGLQDALITSGGNLWGRYSPSEGSPQEITLGDGMALSADGVLSSSASGQTVSTSLVLASGTTQPRQLLAWTGDTLNVLAFSGVSNTGVDCTDALQAAINAAAGRTLAFPPGTYVATSLTIPLPGVELVSVGGTATIKQADGTRANLFECGSTNAVFKLRGLTLDGNWQNSPNSVSDTYYTINFTSNSDASGRAEIDVRDCTFINGRALDIRIRSTDSGYVKTVKIINNKFIGGIEGADGYTAEAIGILGAYDFDVSHNWFDLGHAPATGGRAGITGEAYSTSGGDPLTGTIIGNRFHNFGRDQTNQTVGCIDIYALGAAITIAANRLNSPWGRGIAVKSDSSGVSITGNTVNGLSAVSGYQFGSQIVLNASVSSNIGGGISITGNTCINSGNDAISVTTWNAGRTSYERAVVVSSNSVFNATRRAYAISGGAGVNFSGNAADGSPASVALYLDSNRDYISVTGNIFTCGRPILGLVGGVWYARNRQSDPFRSNEITIAPVSGTITVWYTDHLIDTSTAPQTFTAVSGLPRGEFVTLAASSTSNPLTLTTGSSLFLAGDFTSQSPTQTITLHSLNGQIVEAGRNVPPTSGSLGLGSMAFQSSGAVNITGGTAVLSTVQGTARLSAGSSSAINPYTEVNGTSGTVRSFLLETAGSNRARLYLDSDAESGGDAGSTFKIGIYGDNGSLKYTPFTISRVTGLPVMANGLSVASGMTVTTGGILATGAFGLSGNLSATGSIAAGSISATGLISAASGAVSGTFTAASGVFTYAQSTGALSVGFNGATNPYIEVNGPPGTIRSLVLETRGSNRARVYVDSDAESGGDAGSTFKIAIYGDNGVLKYTPLTARRTDGLVSILNGLLVSGSFQPYTSDGLTATGTDQSGAYALAAPVSVFRTVASGAGAILVGAQGTQQIVYNRGANNLLVYPHSGGNIESYPTNTPVAISVGSNATFNRGASGIWLQM